MAVRDVSGVPNKSPNVPKRLGSTKRSDARKRRSKATSRHFRTPLDTPQSGLEVPSSNLGAPIGGKRCKRGALVSVGFAFGFASTLPAGALVALVLASA